MSEHEKYEELAAGYALGALDRNERHSFEFHLASGCKKCETALRDLKQVTEGLTFALDQAPAGQDAQRQLFDHVILDSDFDEPGMIARRVSKRTKFSILISIALALSIILIVGQSYNVYTLRRKIENQKRFRLQAEERIADLKASLDRITAPQTETVTLTGQGAAAEAGAKAFIDPAQRSLSLYVHNLPPAPPVKTYQLWFIVQGSPVSAGIFRVKQDGSANFGVKHLEDFKGKVSLTVTLEPAGGVSQPTGLPVLVEKKGAGTN